MFKNKEDLNKYMLERYHDRRKRAINLLGGCCIICGSVDELELDHINPETKTFPIAKLWGCEEVAFWNEVRKCQLLCKTCHIQKTLSDNNQTSAKERHGHISCCRYCKCLLCREAKTKYMQKYRLGKKYQ